MAPPFALRLNRLFWPKSAPAPQSPIEGGEERIWIVRADRDAEGLSEDLQARLMEDRGAQTLCASLTGEGDFTLPSDHPNAIATALQSAEPSLIIWIGPHLRPQLLHECHKAGIPLLLILPSNTPVQIDAPLALPGLKSMALNCFDRIVTTYPRMSARLQKLKVDKDRIEILEQLSLGAVTLELDEDQILDLSEQLGTRPRWFARSATASERARLFDAHRNVLKRSHRALLALSFPKGAEMSAMRLKHSYPQFRFARSPERIEDTDQVVVIPPEDETLWHRLAPISFMGQSISPDGGVDPMAAAALGSAIVHGPNVYRYTSVYERLNEVGGAACVRGKRELTETVLALMSADKAAEQAASAWDIATQGAEASERMCDIAHTLLDQRERA